MAACSHPAERPNVDIESRTSITGEVNGSVIAGSVLATFNTGRGGKSTCEFSRLPEKFTPATVGTHT
jgi:hypothetical protein